MQTFTVMGKAVVAIGIVVGIAAIVAVYLFTNVFELAKPVVEQSLNSTKEAASKIQGKDVISEAENVTSTVKNLTSQIKIKNIPP